MTKEAVLISMGVDVAGNLRNLSASLEQSSRTLSGLRLDGASLDLPGTSDEGTMEVLGQVDAIWSPTDELLISGIAAGRFNDQEMDRTIELYDMLRSWRSRRSQRRDRALIIMMPQSTIRESRNSPEGQTPIHPLGQGRASRQNHSLDVEEYC